MVCNIPRTVLNLQELAVIAPSYWRNYNEFLMNSSTSPKGEAISALPLCYSPPFWAHILGSISKIFLTLNASIGCFVYCVMCQIFRKEMSIMLHNVINTIRTMVNTD